MQDENSRPDPGSLLKALYRTIETKNSYYRFKCLNPEADEKLIGSRIRLCIEKEMSLGLEFENLTLARFPDPYLRDE